MARILAALLVLATLVSTAAAAPGSSGNLVTFQDPTSLQILADGTTKSVRFPVAYVAETKSESIRLAVESITRDGIQDEVHDGLFEIGWDGSGPAVTADISLTAALRPGSYQIRVRLDGLVDNQETSQTQQLIVTVPAATVRSLGSFAIQQTVWWPGKKVIDGARLRLQETSRASQLTEIAVQQLSVEAANGVEDTAQLVFDDKPALIPPGETANFTATLDGRFPLGKATGKVEVSASQLAHPYEVAFEVDTAVAKWALVLAIITGILIGYLVKTKVTLAMALGEARLQAANVLHRLQNPEYPDPVFEAMLKKPREELERAIAGNKPEEIADKKTAAETALAAAIQDLNTRRTTAQTALLSVEEIITGRWQVPSVMEAVLQRARGTCQAAQAFLDEGNVETAAKTINPLEEQTKDTLLDSVDAWVSKMRDDLNRYPEDRPPLAVVLANPPAELEQFKADLDAMPTTEMTSGLRQLLQGVSDYRRRLFRFLEGNVLDVSELIGDALIKLAGRIDAVDVERNVEELRENRKIWQTEAVLQALISKNNAIHYSLRLAMLEAADSSIEADVEKLVDQGRYEDAADRILGAVVQTPSGKNKAAGAAHNLVAKGGGSGGARDLYSLDRVEDAIDGQSRVSVRAISAISAPPTAATIRAESRASLIKAKGWNTAIAGVLAVFAGYLVFEDSFIGTPENFAAAFIWAFGIDASIEVLMGTIKTKLGVASV